MTSVDRLAAELATARRDRTTILTRRGTADELGIDTAYDLARRLELERESAGWRPVGWKLGFTNQNLWRRLGLDRPIRARIYEQTLCAGELETAGLVDPRIEPEIVVGFGAAVGPGSDIDAIAGAVAWVAAGLEVVHCHFTGWELSPAEAVADGGLHAALAIGPPTPIGPAALHELEAAACELLHDGVAIAHGRGGDVLGGPLHALQWLLRGLPDGLRAGDIVTTGTLTMALPIALGERWEHRLEAPVRVHPVKLTVK